MARSCVTQRRAMIPANPIPVSSTHAMFSLRRGCPLRRPLHQLRDTPLTGRHRGVDGVVRRRSRHRDLCSGRWSIDRLPLPPPAPRGNSAGSFAHPDAFGETGPLTPGRAFGPRYHIIRILGMGGMGAVYHAWDAELGVAVAIKVIRPEIMADPATAAEVGATLQARAAARPAGHAQERRAHSRPRRDRRHQVHHDVVRQRHRPGHAAQERGTSSGRDGDARGPFGRLGARGRPRRRRRAPRSEARQPHDRRRRRGADHGLRHRALERDSGDSRSRCRGASRPTFSWPRRAWSPA